MIRTYIYFYFYMKWETKMNLIFSYFNIPFSHTRENFSINLGRDGRMVGNEKIIKRVMTTVMPNAAATRYAPTHTIRGKSDITVFRKTNLERKITVFILKLITGRELILPTVIAKTEITFIVKRFELLDWGRILSGFEIYKHTKLSIL